ncbi:MAG: M28 family peptidase [Phycisphaerales bacterium]|nr:MAG: M28 family peptidase [Phycisphaerales bacterium]
MNLTLLTLTAISTMTTMPQPTVESELRCWLPANREAQRELEDALNAAPTPESLRAWHDLICSEPHLAGTDGDRRVVEKLRNAFEELGLETQVHEFWAYLPEPLDAEVQVLVGGRRIDLPLKETALEEDPDSSHPDLTFGWCGFSGSDDVTGELVYANYGRKEDFEKLAEAGIDCRKKIVIARYGGNYRGCKVTYAQEAGAIGLIIYTDPDDDGYRKGISYPEGGWANETSIQRGSLDTLAYPGDALTPFIEATEDAERLNLHEVDLPRVPVQPLSWQAAEEILSRMTGPSVHDLPEAKDWQGGLPFAYRLTGGEDLRVRLMVRQRRRIEKCANVLGVLKGETSPDEKVIIGCHHDAWAFGAGDPNSGTIMVLEAARSFVEAARAGRRPARTIVFAHWGAEEMGIIGSTEWCEGNADDLRDNAVAFINLDMAGMGTEFWAASAPLLKELIVDAGRSVPQASDERGRSLLDVWKDEKDEPEMCNLGGGSDHIAFYCHLGIPSCFIGAHGSKGRSYHTNYDSLHWYRQVVGEGYEPALMITRLANVLLARLANADLLPLDFTRYGADTRTHLDALEKRAEELKVPVDFTELRGAVEAYEAEATAAMESLRQAVDEGAISPEAIRTVNAVLRSMEKSWLDEHGLPGRPWFRNLYAATDPTDGYGGWMLPFLRWGIEEGSENLAAEARQPYLDAFANLRSKLVMIDRVCGQLDDILRQR